MGSTPWAREPVQLQLGEDEVDDTQVIIWVGGKDGFREHIVVRDSHEEISDEEMEEAGGGGPSGGVGRAQTASTAM